MDLLRRTLAQQNHRFSRAPRSEYIPLPTLNTNVSEVVSPSPLSSSRQSHDRRTSSILHLIQSRLRPTPSTFLFGFLLLFTFLLPFITFSSIEYQPKGFEGGFQPIEKGSMRFCSPWSRLSTLSTEYLPRNIKSELISRSTASLSSSPRPSTRLLPSQREHTFRPRSLLNIPDYFTCVTFSSSSLTNSSPSTGIDMSSSRLESAEGGSRLADFLITQKERFLADLKNGNGNGWVVAMGNEAGDLDSVASSIAYATLSTFLEASNSIPLILTPSSLLRLRPENLLALNRSLLPAADPMTVDASAAASVLLHIEDLPVPAENLAEMGVKFALVDHNTLLPQFRKPGTSLSVSGSGSGSGPDPVVAIIDHHEDDGNHSNAPIRFIQVPTGSSASLVTEHFETKWKAAGQKVPSLELSTLLLSSILIDTGGLKAGPKAKTTKSDRKAFKYLLPLSDLSTASSTDTVSLATLEAGEVPSTATTWTSQLLEAKKDVSALSGKELLQRDYKEYELETGVSGVELRVGLSTVPTSLKKWLTKTDGWTGFMDDIDAWMDERKLDVEGVLTTYRSDKGKHRREFLLVYRGNDKSTFDDLVRGLETEGTLLNLEPWSKGDFIKSIQILENGKSNRWGKVWQQGNADATRKQLQPLVKLVVASLGAPKNSQL